MNVSSAAIFFPRGGSAQVLRYLTPRLHDIGVDFALTAGSTTAVPNGDASAFYGSLCRHRVDYDPAFAAYGQGHDPMLTDPPVHPSYEDKAGVPDRSFGRVSPQATAHLESFWADRLREFGFADADVIHLNHLTPMQAGAAQTAPGVPIVATMHGTEIKFWQALLDGQDSGESDALEHAGFWRETMMNYAKLNDRIVVISSADFATMSQRFGIDADRLAYIPHGVDTELFQPRTLDTEEDAALWRDLLIDDCRAAEVGGAPGSLTYTERDLNRLHRGVRLMWLGRFLTQKRLTQLLRAFHTVVRERGDDTTLIVWGGFPGEFEGTHPLELVRELGLSDRVFFAGWRGHDDLARALPSVDALVVPAVNESFGLMYLEAMACGVPVLATSTGGPVDFVVPDGADANGWLVLPDDDDALRASLTAIIADSDARRRRGRNALMKATREFAWTTVAGRYRDLFADLTTRRAADREGRPSCLTVLT